MTFFSTSFVSVVTVILLVFGNVSSQKWEVHGSQQRVNGQDIQKLGGSIGGLGADGLRAGGYERGQLHYQGNILTDGNRALTGHGGISAENMGNRGHNYGLGYQDPKTSLNWDRAITGPVRTDTYRAERNFYTSPDGRGTLGGFVQHSRNNFGWSDTQGGVRGGWNFGR